MFGKLFGSGRPEPKKTENKESSNFHFKLERDENGTYGVFDDYPGAEGLLQQLKARHEVFQVETSKHVFKRQRFSLRLSVGEKIVNLYVKGRFDNKEFVVNDADNKGYPHNLPISRDSIEDIEDQRRKFSVMNELLVNREAVKRYKEKFKKELKIEKPVGFFISSRPEDRGARWAIFEEIQNIIHEIPENKLVDYTEKKQDFEDTIEENFRSIGIKQNTRIYDFVGVGTVDNPDFILLDSEDWQKLDIK